MWCPYNILKNNCKNIICVITILGGFSVLSPQVEAILTTFLLSFINPSNHGIDVDYALWPKAFAPNGGCRPLFLCC
jgi:hypothetical protein